MVDFAKDEYEILDDNFLWEILYFRLTLKRDRNRFSISFLFCACFGTDPIYHIWKSPLGGP